MQYSLFIQDLYIQLLDSSEIPNTVKARHLVVELTL